MTSGETTERRRLGTLPSSHRLIADLNLAACIAYEGRPEWLVGLVYRGVRLGSVESDSVETSSAAARVSSRSSVGDIDS